MIPILTTSSVILCPHGGTVSLTTANSVCQIEGAPALLQSDQHTVSGCPFQKPLTPPVPSPCVTVQWLTGATRTRVNGTPVLLQTSSGLCLSGESIPQGAPIIAMVQSSAKGQ